MTALVTPMRAGEIDERALAELVEMQISEGIHALVPAGTTGEAATLTPEEQRRVIACVVKQARRRVAVIAGAGSNSTREAIALAAAAKEEGVDGLLVITPYYNRPTQEGLYRHFQAVAAAVPLPMVVYNVPARTGCDLGVDTLERLTEIREIVGVKEATGSVQRAQQIVTRLGQRMPVYCADDAINYPLYAIGAQGCISVVSNVAPKLIASGWNAVVAGDHARASALHLRSLPLTEALFVESNPIPVKAALGLLGLSSTETRIPLTEASDTTVARLKKALADLGLPLASSPLKKAT